MNHEFICEKCGEKVKGTIYTEDMYRVIEEHYECPKCGFHRHWAYGYITPEDSEYEEIPDSK